MQNDNRHDIDRDRGVWTIPPVAEKAGETRGAVRKVSLSTQALELLAAQREHNLVVERRALHGIADLV